MADFDAPEHTVDHAAGVFANILETERKDAEALAANPPPPEPKEPPSRFALPGRPEVEPEEPDSQEPAEAAVEGQEAAPIAATEETPSNETQRAEVPQTPAQPQAPIVDEKKQAELNQYVQNAAFQFLQAATILSTQFPDIKSWDDLSRIAATDPDRYNQYAIAKWRYDEADKVRNQAYQAQQQFSTQQRTQWEQSEGQKLTQLIPELNDPEKAPIVASQIRAYALKEGITAQQLAQADAMQMKQLYRAMQFEQAQAKLTDTVKAQAAALAQAKQKAADAPPVQKPGMTRTTSTKDDKVQSDYRRLRKSGSVDDAAALFKSMGL